jgi:hypothetical protein
MIRTHIIPCNLPKIVADALNRASAAVYSRTLVTHYRVYRKRGNRKRHWLSQFAAMRLNDYLTRDDPPLLHAHSKDAAQQAFYKACKTAKANRTLGANYPHKRKLWRTTIWKQSGIRRQGSRLLLSRAKGLPPIAVDLPEQLQDRLKVLEARLVYDRRAHCYTWHLVVENGKQPKAAPGMNAVELVDEHYTSQTCPNCEKRHKPRGRVYTCGRCGFSAHRDVVGQINILSRYRTGKVGALRVPGEVKHRIPHNLRVMRRCRDTGQPKTAVARGTGCQPREAAGL